MDKTILVIEDDEEVLRVYKVFLGKFGQVRIAQNMKQARGQLEGVDLIILDYHLRNEKTSFEACVEELKPHAPILLCSGIPDRSIPARGKDMGVVSYWNKGTGLEVLSSKVQSVLHPSKE